VKLPGEAIEMSFLDKPEKKTNGFAVVIFLILGLVGILISLKDIVDARASLKWPTVKGWIVKSEIRISKDKGTAYCPVLTWNYIVNGKKFNVPNDPFCSTLAQAKAKIAKFPMGARVTISYSPSDPGNSTLEPGVLKMPIYVLLLGVVSIVIGLFNL
jgi:Protein of unknown function (DUF3592)